MRPAAEILNKMIWSTDKPVMDIYRDSGVGSPQVLYNWTGDKAKAFFEDVVKVANACGYKIVAVRGEEVIECGVNTQ